MTKRLEVYRCLTPKCMATLVLLFLCTACSSEAPPAEVPQAPQPDPYRAAREKMVRNDIARDSFNRQGVKDARVLAAMRKVPRHEFVPLSLRQRAYDDRPLPIGQQQTISQPYIVAFMTEALEAESDDVVLEIGTGSGYQAAVLAEIVNRVYTIEIIPALGKEATQRLTALGYDNIHVKIGDGYHGWPKHAPFDSIIVTAGADHVPPALLKQLKPGGRMVIPVGPAGEVQSLTVVEKQTDGSVKQRHVMAVRFVPFTRSKKQDAKE